MVVSTPNPVYNMQAASQLLSNYYKDEYEPQIAALVNEGMLNKNINSMKTPGRMYGYANAWLYAAEGFVPPEVPSQVRDMQAKLAAEGEMTWPLVGHPGDLATYMQMVSNHEVSFMRPGVADSSSTSTSTPTRFPRLAWSVSRTTRVH